MLPMFGLPDKRSSTVLKQKHKMVFKIKYEDGRLPGCCAVWLVKVYRHFRGAHGATTQKTAIFILTTVRT
jgi:hypothetical protein